MLLFGRGFFTFFSVSWHHLTLLQTHWASVSLKSCPVWFGFVYILTACVFVTRDTVCYPRRFVFRKFVRKPNCSWSEAFLNRGLTVYVIRWTTTISRKRITYQTECAGTTKWSCRVLGMNGVVNTATNGPHTLISGSTFFTRKNARAIRENTVTQNYLLAVYAAQENLPSIVFGV